MRSLQVALIVLLALVHSTLAWSQQKLSHGRFHDVALYRPQGNVKSVVLLLSAESGWDAVAADTAKALSAEGALVAGIDTPALFREFEHDGEACAFPAGDIENLSHVMQGYAKLSTYHAPILVGLSSGATFAYALIAQAPAGTFAGALSLGFCEHLQLAKPMCKGEGVRYAKRKDGKSVDLLSDPALKTPWIVLQGEQDHACPVAKTSAFTRGLTSATMVSLPGVGRDYSAEKSWMPQLLAEYRQLAVAHSATLPAPPASLGSLPIVEVSPSHQQGSTFAVLLSGDGGWAGLDRDVAGALSRKGVPVVGFDSLRYFWTSRTPDGLATDLDKLIRYYAAHWSKQKVLLIGYSQGADVLPFAVNRLPATTRTLLHGTVLMGLGEKASFEFQLGNWIGSDDGGLPVEPEMRRLSSTDTLCLYGKDESDSLCPQVQRGRIKAQALPGGHHFDGAYDKLAQLILSFSAKLQ